MVGQVKASVAMPVGELLSKSEPDQWMYPFATIGLLSFWADTSQSIPSWVLA